MKSGSLEWKKQEREWLLSDIEFQLWIIERWESMGYEELAAIDRRILREKRKALRELRGDARYGERYR